MAHQKTAGKGCIYCIYEGETLTRKSARYVGKTNDYDVRLEQHKKAAEDDQYGRKTAALNVDRKIAAGLKAGKNYKMVCLKHAVALSLLSGLEKELIAAWQTYGFEDGWNETEGG